MQDKLPSIENTSAVTERRACPRLRVTSLMYIDIGNVNGGIVTSLSEKGLALTAAATMASAEFGDGPLRMHIQFPGTPEAIQATGEIVWTSPSGKEARVRFVEIEETAREQIRGWISNQVSSNGLRPEPPRLPKMQLPSSRHANPRGPRFSFADVASSRVNPESETGVEDFPEVIRQPGDLPPLQAGSSVFRDGTEVVASAFESPAFAEDQTRNIGPSQNGQTTHPTPDEQLRQQGNPAIPELRQHARRQILLFTYAVLGQDNGGLVFNLGEGGLALTAAAALQEHHFSKIRVRFPDSTDWFETSGRLAWKNDSGKEAGIEFLNLPADARARIGEWASQAELAGDLASNKDETRAQELPSFMEPEFSSTEPIEIPASFEEQPFENQVFEGRYEERAKTPAAPSSALFKIGIKGIFKRASVRRRIAKIKPPRLADHSARPRTHVVSKALSIAAGAALAVGGWMLFQRAFLNEASGIVARDLPDTQSSQEPLQARAPEIAKTEVGARGTTPDPQIQPSQTSTTQNGISASSLQQIEKAPTPPTPKTSATTANSGAEPISKEKSQTKDALKHMPVESSPPSSNQTQHPAAPLQRDQEAKSTEPAASVPAHSPENKLAENMPAGSKPAESKPVQINQAFPPPNKDLSATSPLPSSNPSQPSAAPPVDLEKEKSPLAPKQPEPIFARTPVVTVSFDPFPSIRMPTTEKSKKSHQGKNLQMGRLLSRVDPAYPDEAKQQGVEGTAKVHAIFKRDGAVQSVISISGPPLLVSAAINAVRQWRYSQTILGGQAMETEEDVTVLFRLTNSAAKN